MRISCFTTNIGRKDMFGRRSLAQRKRSAQGIFIVLVAICCLLVGSTIAFAALTNDSWDSSGTASYNAVFYAISWTVNDAPQGSACGPSDSCIVSISGEAEGGCVHNNWYPFDQIADGSITYNWSGGSQGPIHSTINGASQICQSTDYFWGGGPTYTSPQVVYWKIDPAGTDYSTVFSQWHSNQAYPYTLSDTRYRYWN
jgi:hypothetical protein